MGSFFQHRDIRLFFRKIGQGNKPIIAFHGFTKDSSDYELFAPIINNEYTIYAVDLFYHGNTTFDSKKWKSFTKPQLKAILEAFVAHLKLKEFDVLGYSMGGRLALFMLEQFSEQVNKVILMAPDGLKINFWNWLVTNTRTGKGIYGLAISNPGIVYGISNTGQRLNLLPSTMNKFLDINFKTKGMRLRVYRVWQLYKHITFNQKTLKKIIESNNLHVELVIGHKDPVVAPKTVKDFAELIDKNATLHSIKAGHDLFKPHVLKYLKNNLFNCND